MKSRPSEDVCQLWTPADLARRWGCSVATTLDRVRTKSVPYLWLGPGEARLTGRGAKFIRFRPQAVEAWEAAIEGHWSPEPIRRETVVRRVASNDLLRGHRAKCKPD